jgi:hypothetical protein
LDQLESFRNPADGKLEMKMYWPDRSNVWRQKSNPAMKGVVSGYAPVTIRYPDPFFGGLELFNDPTQTTTVIEGSTAGTNTDWFYSVGYMGSDWTGQPNPTIPAANTVSANGGALQAELYVKVAA